MLSRREFKHIVWAARLTLLRYRYQGQKEWLPYGCGDNVCFDSKSGSCRLCLNFNGLKRRQAPPRLRVDYGMAAVFYCALILLGNPVRARRIMLSLGSHTAWAGDA